MLERPTRELDPDDVFDRALLAEMVDGSELVAPGVLAMVLPWESSMEIRAILATDPRIPGAVGRWLDGLPRDRPVVVPAVTSPRLAGMLERRGFEHRRWYDHSLGILSEAHIRRPAR
jgi:hypothetical protein